VAEPDLEQVRRRPGWNEISAVRHDCIAPVDEIWINAPGPNLAKGARLLAESLGRMKR